MPEDLTCINCDKVARALIKKVVGKDLDTLSSLSVVGISTIGKTKVFKYLANEKRSLFSEEAVIKQRGARLAFKYINLYGYFRQDGTPYFDRHTSIIEALAYELRYIVKHDSPKGLNLDIKSSTEKQLQSILAAYRKSKIHLLLLLDDCDHAFNNLTLENEEFLFGLMDKQNENYHAIITATKRSFAELVKTFGHGHKSQLPKHLKSYNISLLPEEDARAITKDITTHLKIELTPDENDFLLNATGGHIGLLKAAYKGYANFQSASKIHLDKQRLQEHTKELHKALLADEMCKEIFAEIWSSLTKPEQDVLLKIVAKNTSSYIDAAQQLQNMGLVKGSMVFEIQNNRGKASKEHLVFKGELFSSLFDDYIRVVHAEDYKESLRNFLNTLSGTEYHVFRSLIGRPNHVCSYEELYLAGWSRVTKEKERYKNKVEIAVSRIKKDLESYINKDLYSGLKPDHEYIVNVRGRGYRLVLHQ